MPSSMPRPRVNYLMGFIGFVGGLIMWGGSLEAVRRRAYYIFYGVHRAAFWVFLIGAVMHYQGTLW